MKRLSSILLSTLFLAFASNVYAEKVGVVNIDAILLQAPLSISLNDKMSKDFKPRQDALNAAQRKLQDSVDVLNFTGYRMSNADRTALQTSINNAKRDLDRQAVALQNDLATAQTQNTQILMNKLNEVVKKIAADGKYDLIQTSANVLYLNNTIDVTPQVIQLLK